MFFCKEKNIPSDHVHKLCKLANLAHIILKIIAIAHLKGAFP